LGLANFYRRFIRDFSKIATPLNNLMRKENVWRWGGKPRQKAFDELKRRFCGRTYFGSRRLTRARLRVESDASDFATGAVLSMLCEDEKWQPVCISI